jgi:hypothetical protein
VRKKAEGGGEAHPSPTAVGRAEGLTLAPWLTAKLLQRRVPMVSLPRVSTLFPITICHLVSLSIPELGSFSPSLSTIRLYSSRSRQFVVPLSLLGGWYCPTCVRSQYLYYPDVSQVRDILHRGCPLRLEVRTLVKWPIGTKSCLWHSYDRIRDILPALLL